MVLTDEKLKKQSRKYYPQDLAITDAGVLEREAEKLLDFPLTCSSDLIKYLGNWSELSAMVHE